MQDKTTGETSIISKSEYIGKSRGFGFVTYKDPKILDHVLSKAHIIDGKEVKFCCQGSSVQVDCKRAVPRDQQNETPKEENIYRTKKLFVGGLPQTTNEGRLLMI
jgi:hypothetical protein